MISVLTGLVSTANETPTQASQQAATCRRGRKSAWQRQQQHRGRTRACERGSGRAQLPQRAMKLPQRQSLTSTSVPSTRHQPHSQRPPGDNPEPREHTDDGDSRPGRSVAALSEFEWQLRTPTRG